LNRAMLIGYVGHDLEELRYLPSGQLTKWRQPDGDDVNAEKKIFPECSLL
jgi:hypothetical protein